MKKLSIKRIIGGILFTVAFIAFARVSISVAVHSSDLDNYLMTDLNKVYGYNRNQYLINHGRADEVTEDKYEPEANEAELSFAQEEYEAPAVETIDIPELPPEPVEETMPEPSAAELKAASRGLPAPPEIDITQWQYVLVNGEHPLDPIDYAPENLVYLNIVGDDTQAFTWYDQNRQVVDAFIAEPLIAMTQACKAAGLPVYLSSGYRSYSDQAANFQRVCANNGISDGKNAEGHYITMPAGCSEHQTGLCIDITDYYREIKNDSIAQTATVQWLADHCAEYGFVLRFPADKRDITHVMSESWHFRYVGEEAARYMTDNNLCLEEFVELYT